MGVAASTAKAADAGTRPSSSSSPPQQQQQLAPSAVKFGSLGEVSPLRGVALCRARTGASAASGSNVPVVVAVSKECIDLYNAVTGE